MTPAHRNLSTPGELAAARSGNLLLITAVVMMLAAAVGIFVLVFGMESIALRIERAYLIPWVLACGVVFAAPLLYLKKRGEFTIIHPIVFPVLIYFFPIFFIGGWSLVFGLSNFYYLSYVNNPEWDFPMAFLYVILGFLGLSGGFFTPRGKKIGRYLSTWMPSWDLKPNEIVVTSVVFLFGGLYLMIIALEVGQFGYQGSDLVVGSTGSLSFFLALIAPTSTFLLWIAFFKIKGWGPIRFAIISIELCTAFFMLMVAGSKSILLMSVISFVAAMMLVERKVSTRRWIVLGLVGFLALFLGVLYGNTFRNIKGNNERISVDRYLGIAGDSFTQMGQRELSAQFEESFYQMAERLEIASSLAVVVSNYEALAVYEEGYGLDNNIWRYTWTALIPRFIWNDKPTIADNYSYNELYFGYGGFGLAITAMGDLLRNFGPIGVPVGMFVLGFFLRIFYATLIEGVPFSAWKGTLYFNVLTYISYDSFYGQILPTVIRVGVVVMIQLILMRLLVLLFRGRERA